MRYLVLEGPKYKLLIAQFSSSRGDHRLVATSYTSIRWLIRKTTTTQRTGCSSNFQPYAAFALPFKSSGLVF